MKTKESILCQLDSSPLKEKYESVLRKYVEDRGAVINGIEKTTQHLLLNQKKIKELSGLDVSSKKSVMKTSVNFLYKTLTLNQKINMKLINENKNLRKKMKELRKRSLVFIHNTISD